MKVYKNGRSEYKWTKWNKVDRMKKNMTEWEQGGPDRTKVN